MGGGGGRGKRSVRGRATPSTTAAEEEEEEEEERKREEGEGILATEEDLGEDDGEELQAAWVPRLRVRGRTRPRACQSRQPRMTPWRLLRCCQWTAAWVPVLFIAVVICWSYYTFVVELCLFTIAAQEEEGKAAIYLVIFHLSFVLFMWSYWKTIFTPPVCPSKEFFLSQSDEEHYEKEERPEVQQEILKRVAKELPVYTMTSTKLIRYCEKCQLIKPDRCHHCSVCNKVNNCVGFSNYKYFLLFLFYSLVYCILVTTTVLEYFIKFWTLCRRKSAENCPKTNLRNTRAQFHVLFLFFVATMFFISILSLFCYHLWLVGKNRTTIEAFRAPVFLNGPDKNGFSLGWSKNWRQVFGDEKKYWLFPIFTSLGDGVHFPTRLMMDKEHVTGTNHHEHTRSSGSTQNFSVGPLSESKNFLLATGSEQDVSSGMKNHVTVSIES
ncbi:palmitoyltransferase ZDHHC20 isoform X2 [Sarcophilus harrisii]|uniref:Palmitoyltransferase n=1 Tax=Sarcophilus harrisii TaxID=9305 RepID=A0A7N4Q1V4_SARHA|nr:palmitoyltransferase ZDHHC20 isoform X2 [Sarcophilus harrisii]